MTPEKFESVLQCYEQNAYELDFQPSDFAKEVRSLQAALAERTRERDDAQAVIAMPTDEEMDAYNATLTPADHARREAVRELVVSPDLLTTLRAALSASQAECAEQAQIGRDLQRMVDARVELAALRPAADALRLFETYCDHAACASWDPPAQEARMEGDLLIDPPSNPCNCGFVEARSKVRAALALLSPEAPRHD